jgi:RNase adaptor protein for sRNA GlmZ degradation
MNPIKLVYDKYENDVGFNFGSNNDEIIENDNVINMIDVSSINKNNKVIFYTYGIKKQHNEKTNKIIQNLDISFDATLFFAQLNNEDGKHINVKNFTGMDDIIQTSIIKHPLFVHIIEKIILNIENSNINTVGIFCNHGKHRSVGFVEILHKYYYTNSIIIHLDL